MGGQGLNPVGLGGSSNDGPTESEEVTTEQQGNEYNVGAIGGDAAALADAVSRASPSGEVHVGENVIDISSVLSAGDETDFYGSGHLTSQIRLATGVDKRLIEWTGGSATNIDVEDIRLDGQNQNGTSPLVYFDGNADPTFRNVWFQNGGERGLYWTGGQGGVIDRCYLENHNSWGLEVDASGSGVAPDSLWINKTKVTNNPDGVHISGGVRGWITDCNINATANSTKAAVWMESADYHITSTNIVQDAAKPAVIADAIALELNGGRITSAGKGVVSNANLTTVDDVFFDQVSGRAVECGSHKQQTVEGCKFLNCGADGVLMAGEGGDVKDCNFLNTTGRAVRQFSGTGLAVTGNTSINAGTGSNTEHFRFDGVNGLTATGNTIIQESGVGTADGMYLKDVTNATIVGNTFLGADLGAGIYIPSGTDIDIWGTPASQVAASGGTRVAINGKSTNAGNPATTGQWNTYHQQAYDRGVLGVRDTTNSVWYVPTPSGWENWNTTAA